MNTARIRLASQDVMAIREEFSRCFLPTDRLWLFGSRANPHAKGGDIDLYIETDCPDVGQATAAKLAFLIALEDRIGGQKIDAVLQFGNMSFPIHRIAKAEGVQLVPELATGLTAPLPATKKEMQMIMSERTASLINVCQIHASRLGKALQHVAHLCPILPTTLDQCTDEELGFFEILTNRFAKLQDSIGANIFPLLLDSLEENAAHLSMLDRLHRLEKLEIIASADRWKEMRAIRNHVAHEYPDNPALMAKYLNDLIECVPFLLAEWKALLDRVRHYE